MWASPRLSVFYRRKTLHSPKLNGILYGFWSVLANLDMLSISPFMTHFTDDIANTLINQCIRRPQEVKATGSQRPVKISAATPLRILEFITRFPSWKIDVGDTCTRKSIISPFVDFSVAKNKRFGKKTSYILPITFIYGICRSAVVTTVKHERYIIQLTNVLTILKKMG